MTGMPWHLIAIVAVIGCLLILSACLIRALRLRNRAMEDLEAERKNLAALIEKRTKELSRINRELADSEERFRRLSDAAFEGVIISDGGMIIEANRTMTEMFGYSQDELVGLSSASLVAPDLREDVRVKIAAGYDKPYESIGLTKEGIQFPIGIHARMFVYKGRQVRCAAVRDLSERKRAQEALQDSEDKFRAIATGAQDAIIMMDGHGRITLWNQSAQRIFHYTAQEMMGRNPHELMAPAKYLERFEAAYPRFQQTGQGDVIGKTIELSALRKGGEIFPIELSLSSVKIKNQWYAIAVVRDITGRKRLEAELTKLATTDALTGINNRHCFLTKAREEFNRSHRYQRAFSMVMIDIDHFKRINDTYGHHTGDVVLREMALAAGKALRENDIFGRVGGEEFSAVLIEADMESAAIISERLRSRIQAMEIKTDKGSIRITVSIGLATRTEGDDEFETVSKRADNALYQAKDLGRNRTCFH